MKTIYCIVFLITSCSPNKGNKSLNADRKNQDTIPMFTYNVNKNYLNDTAIQQTNSLFFNKYRIDVITNYFIDSAWFGQGYVPVINEQFIEFNSKKNELLSTLEIRSKKVIYTTDTNKKILGRDNFIYKVFPVQIDSGFVFLAYGMGINNLQEVFEYSNVYSSNGFVIYNGYENLENYDTLDLFWKTHGVTYSEIKDASFNSIVYIFLK